MNSDHQYTKVLRSMPIRMVLVIVSLMILNGCSSTLKLRVPVEYSSADVPMFGRIPSREFIDSSLFTFPLSKIWEYDASAGFGSGPPIVAGNVLFMGTLQGELNAINIQTGKSISYVKTFAPISSSPALYKQYLIVGNESTNENLICFNTDNGEVQWTRNIGGVVSSPLIKNDLLFQGGLDGKFYCLDAASGSKKWMYDTEYPIRSSSCSWNELVFCANTHGTVYAFDLNTGAMRWKYGTRNAVFAGLTASNGKLFVASRDSNLYILDADSGLLYKKIPIGDKIMASPSVENGTVFVSSLNGSVSAYSVIDGSLKWKFQSKSAMNTTPVVTASAVFVVSLDQYLYAISPSDGTILWKYDFESRIKTTPLVWKNSIIIAAENKNIYLFR